MENPGANKKITIAWWNTTLSPHSKENTASEEHKDFVIYTLFRLMQIKNVDVLCLCEVSKDDIDFLNNNLLPFLGGFSIYDGTIKDGRKKFDLCVIYRSNILQFVNSEIISKLQVKKKIYAGQEVNFITSDFGEPMTLYLVHWSSRMYDYEDSPNKGQLGTLLRDAVNDCRETRHIKHVIILGDFNEEPFNKSITNALFASRDIALVKKSPRLLYNPFWRHMVHGKFHPQKNIQNEDCGTYYYKSDEFNRWKTFDQIIFSSDFISGDSWFLNESKTEVFSDEEFIDYICSSKSKFDHLPIISVIERIIHA